MIMNSITITKLYDQLSSKVGKETAESLITFIEQKIREELKDNARALAGSQEYAAFRAGKKARFLEKMLWVVLVCFIIEIAVILGLPLFHLRK